MRKALDKRVRFISLISGITLVALLLLTVLIARPNKEYVFEPLPENSALSLNATYQEFDLFQEIALPAGVYNLYMEYETDTDLNYWVYPVDGTVFFNGLQSNGEVLYSGLSSTSFMMWLWEGTEQMTLHLTCNGEGSLRVGTLTVRETDKLWTMVMTMVVAVYGLVMVIYWLKSYFSKAEDAQKKKTVLCLLSFIAIIASIPYLWGVVIGGADLTYHLQRIEGVKDGLLSGNFPVRLEPEWVHGHGYANAIFYCNALLLFPAILRLLGFTVTASYCAYCIMLNIAVTGIAYYCFSRIFKDEYIGVMCSALYTLSIFRIYKLVITGATGEGSAVTFMPLVLYGLYRAFSEDIHRKEYKTAWVPIMLGYAGLIQTHVLSCEITAMLTIIVCLLFVKKIFRLNTFMELAKGALGALGLSMWYLVPFLDYYLTQDLHIKHVSGRTIQERGIYIAQLFMNFWKSGNNALTGAEGMYHSHAMGIGFLLGMAFVVFLLLWIWGDLKGKKDSRLKLGKYALGLGGLMMLMSLKVFPWDKIQAINGVTASLVSSIQFPNRFLGWGTAFMVTVFGAICIYLQKQKKAYLNIMAVLTIISMVSSSMFAIDYINAGLDQMRIYNEEGMGFGYISGEEYKFEGTDPGLLLYSEPKASEDIHVLSYYKEYLEVQMTVKNESSEVGYIELPLINYKGYVAVDVASGENLPIAMGTNSVICVSVPGEYEGNIMVEFRSPWYWRLAEGISYGMWLVVLTGAGMYLMKKRRWKMENEKVGKKHSA